MYTTHYVLAQQAQAITLPHLQIKGNKMHYTNTDNPIDFPKDPMDSQTKEVMDILQEECAEVIQAVSKISRFGLDNFKPGKPKTNREHLEEELGDLYAMIEILQELDVVSWTNIELAAEAKSEKLKKWSNIFTENIIQR
jgi:NTP pyrophosphatase (non-canonical NTP hydrolase)